MAGVRVSFQSSGPRGVIGKFFLSLFFLFFLGMGSVFVWLIARAQSHNRRGRRLAAPGAGVLPQPSASLRLVQPQPMAVQGEIQILVGIFIVTFRQSFFDNGFNKVVVSAESCRQALDYLAMLPRSPPTCSGKSLQYLFNMAGTSFETI
jgi:hypothetical protein